MHERRKSNRVAIDTGPITGEIGRDAPFGVVNLENDHPLGCLADISPDGLRLNTWKHIELGTLFNLRIRLPEEIEGGRFIVLDACCMWSKPTADEDGWYAGFQFISITPSNQKRIDALIAMLHCVHGEAPRTEAENT